MQFCTTILDNYHNLMIEFFFFFDNNDKINWVLLFYITQFSCFVLPFVPHMNESLHSLLISNFTFFTYYYTSNILIHIILALPASLLSVESCK